MKEASIAMQYILYLTS